MLQAGSSSSPAGCAGRGPWWSRLSPCSPWVPHGADLHAAAPPWVEEPPVEQVAVAWRRLRPIESPRRSRPRAGAAARGEEPTWSRVREGPRRSGGDEVLQTDHNPQSSPPVPLRCTGGGAGRAQMGGRKVVLVSFLWFSLV